MFCGSTRSQCFARTTHVSSPLIPNCDAIYKISQTKNGEQGALFALPSFNILGPVTWRGKFHDMLAEFGTAPGYSHSSFQNSGCKPVKVTRESTQDDSKAIQTSVAKFLTDVGAACGYTPAQLKELHITPHSLHGSMIAYASAATHEFDVPSTCRLGRHAIPSGAPAGMKRKRGAGSVAPKSISAVYSTAAECQIQLDLRSRMLEMLMATGASKLHGADLSLLIA
jgi:hypothetical protein